MIHVVCTLDSWLGVILFPIKRNGKKRYLPERWMVNQIRHKYQFYTHNNNQHHFIHVLCAVSMCCQIKCSKRLKMGANIHPLPFIHSEIPDFSFTLIKKDIKMWFSIMLRLLTAIKLRSKGKSNMYCCSFGWCVKIFIIQHTTGSCIIVRFNNLIFMSGNFQMKKTRKNWNVGLSVKQTKLHRFAVVLKM